MKDKKDIRMFMRMHELSLHFKHDGNFNAAELCSLDNKALEKLLNEGYKPSEIMKAATSAFQGSNSEKRYNILKKYIEDFDKKQKDGNNSI